MKEPTPELLRRRLVLGERIRALRKHERNLGVDNLHRLADALGCSVRDFF